MNADPSIVLRVYEACGIPKLDLMYFQNVENMHGIVTMQFSFLIDFNYNWF